MTNWCLGHWDGLQRWFHSTLTKGQRFKLIPAPSNLWQEVWLRVTADRMLCLRYSRFLSCLNNRMLKSGYRCLIFQVSKQAIARFVLCIMVKQSFAYFPVFWIGVYKHIENKCGQIQHSLDCPPGSILHLHCFPFISLLLLSNIPNPYISTLERANPVEAGPQHFPQ